jgi:hypothetical protein
MGAGVLQQGPHLRRAVGSAQASADNSFLHIAIMTRESTRLRQSSCWGNKWGNMPYRFQPIST